MLHRVNLVSLMALGTLWAGALVVLGAMLASGDLAVGRGWSTLRPLKTALGVSFVAAGLFVFAVIVADRVFPRAARLVTTLVETALGLTMLGGAISIVLTLATGASG